MTDALQEKIAWLNSQTAAVEQKRQAKREQRRKTWQRIQRDYPDHARMMTELAKVFGKPESVTMIDEKAGERVLCPRGWGRFAA